MGYVYVKIFLGTPVHLGASATRHNMEDAPRYVPTFIPLTPYKSNSLKIKK